MENQTAVQTLDATIKMLSEAAKYVLDDRAENLIQELGAVLTSQLDFLTESEDK